MGRLSLAVILALWATTSAPRPVTFIHPRVPLVLAKYGGVEIPVQIRIEPHPDNRAYVITWCEGSSGKSLDGDQDSALHPAMKPLHVRVFTTCDFTATVFGPGGKVRASETITVKVCGGEEGPC